LTGTVVIAKNPCFHPGDMRKFQAVDNPMLRHMVDVVVFPIKGPRPHPDEMSGSDLDGDMYFICWEETLIPPRPNEKPMDYTAMDKERLDREIIEDDMITFLGRYVESDQLGVIANAHLVHADAQKDHIFSKQCLDLSHKHSDAVDFPKTGCLVTIPFELRPRGYPRYMHKRDKPIYRSNHVLAGLYNQCKAIDSTVRACTPHVPVHRDDRFMVPGYEPYLDSALQLLDFYRGQMHALMTNYGVVSEPEIVSGHFRRIVQRQSGTLKREYVDTSDLIRRHLETIRLKIRSMFFEEFGGDDKKTDNREQAIKKISALYRLAYESEEELGIGLPWMFADLLMSARSCNKEYSVPAATEEQNTVGSMTDTHSASLLDVLSDEIVSFSNSHDADEQLCESREKRKNVLVLLRNAVTERQISAIDFVCFGSTVTGYDHPSSTLDVLVVYDKKDSSLSQAVEIVNQIFTASPLVGNRPVSDGSKPVIVTVDKQDVAVHWTERNLQRTAKIVAVTSRNQWIVPILHAILRWARRKNISASRRDCLLTPEQLTLLFTAFAEKEVLVQRTTNEDVEQIRQLLLANHFLNCEITKCQHTGASEYGEMNGPRKADVLLKFFQHYSQLRGQLVKDVCDVVFPDEVAPKLVQLEDPQYGRIAERMLQAYYCLATSGTLEELLQISVTSLSKVHRVIPLARQVASIVIFRQEYYEQKLQRTSGATSVKILRKEFPSAMAGLCLDVWGDQRSLLLIEDSVRDLEQMSTLFVRSAAAIERQMIHGANLGVFENSIGPTAEVSIEPFRTGAVQSYHRRAQSEQKIHVPRLLNPCPSDAYSQERFVDCVMRQVDFLNRSYDETLFGELRAVVSYGTCYVVADQTPLQMSEEKFTERLNLDLPTNNENLVNPDRAMRRPRASRAHRGNRPPRSTGEAGHLTYSSVMEPFSNLSLTTRGRRQSGAERGAAGRSRGSHSDRGSTKPTQWRAAYIPAKEFNSEKFTAFRESNGFEFDEEYRVYLITVRLKMSGYQSNLDGVLVLDDQQRLKGLTMTDTKWICVNIYTDKAGRTDGRAVNDIRFRIHSRVSLSPLEMAEHSEDCAELIQNHGKLLRCDQQGDVIEVAPDYRSRITYVRYKNCRVFQLAENPQVRFQ